MGELTDHRGRPRVAITGMGVKCPAGIEVETAFKTVLAGRSVAVRVQKFRDLGLVTDIACLADGFEPTDYMTAKRVRKTDRVAHLGYAAAMDAIADAGLATAGIPAERCGVMYGTGAGGGETVCNAAVKALEYSFKVLSPTTVPMMMPNATSAHISIEMGWTGPSMALGTACASGTNAIGEATRLIRDGYCDVVAAGGGENSMSPYLYAAFTRSGAMSRKVSTPTEASRPFDVDRDGYVMGEGAGFLILERLDAALARGAHVHGEIVGYGFSCDAFHLTAPREDGSVAAMCVNRALEDAGLAPSEIRQVNAHGTSTTHNDKMEATAISRVFGEREIPVTSNKGVFGHLMGASGAVEAVMAVRSADQGVVPPTANHDRTDPDCTIDVVADEPRTVPRGPVVSNSFGFGGHNAALVFAPVG